MFSRAGVVLTQEGAMILKLKILALMLLFILTAWAILYIAARLFDSVQRLGHLDGYSIFIYGPVQRPVLEVSTNHKEW